jgi:predicted Ser/Thr protein kinase
LPTELKHDSTIAVTEPPKCENINDLYASIRLPFQLKSKPIERVYARILVSSEGKVQNLIFTTKNPDALTALALLPALTRLKFKPAIHEKKAIPYWITLPIQLENK